jgi:hypothetical protein
MQARVASSQAFQSNFHPDYKTIHGSVVNWADASLEEPEGLSPEQAKTAEKFSAVSMLLKPLLKWETPKTSTPISL